MGEVMSLLTDDELADLRSDILDTLPDTCTIQRSTNTADSYGFADDSWANSSTGVRCRLDPDHRRNSENTAGEKESTRVFRILTVQYDADLRAGDRVVVGSNTYEVVELDDDHSLRAVRRARVARLD
jgi:head-tail adaptor